jgi:putative tricarboxylic transport membrane protein
VTSLVVAGMALLLLPLVLQIVRLLRGPDETAQEKVRII